jgi:hypothetical protein
MGASNSFETMPFPKAIEKHSIIKTYVNLSVGGSSGLLAFRSLANLNVNEFDYMLLDFAVNEIEFIEKGSTSIEQIHAVVDEVCSMVHSLRIIPIITLFPVKNKKNNPVNEFYRNYAIQRNILLLDLYTIVDLFKPGSEQDDLFESPNHINEKFATLCANYTIEYLGNLRKTSLKEIDWITHQYKYIPVEELLNTAAIFTHTSIDNAVIKESLVSFSSQNESLTITLDDDWMMVGYSADFANTSCYLSIEGADTIKVDMGTAIYNSGRKNVLFILPISKEIVPKDTKVTLSARCSNKDDGNLLCYSQWKKKNVDYSQLDGVCAFGAVILKSKHKISRKMSLDISYMDITRLWSKSDFVSSFNATKL